MFGETGSLPGEKKAVVDFRGKHSVVDTVAEAIHPTGHSVRGRHTQLVQ